SGMGPPGVVVSNANLGAMAEDAPDKAGATLTDVAADGPADRAGLKLGDIITKLGDQPIKSNVDLLEAVRSHKADDRVKIRVMRDKEERDIDLTFGQRPRGGGRFGGGGGGGGADPDRPFGSGFNGQQENVQDRQGADGYMYGGVYRSADGG